MPSKKRAIVLAASILGGFVLALAFGAWLLLSWARPKLRQHIVDVARQQGFELAFDDVAIAPTRLVVYDARIRPIGMTTLHVTAERINVDLSGFEPEHIKLFDVEARATGSLPRILFELSEWTKNYPTSYELPLEAEAVDAYLRSTASAEPWLVVTQGTLEHEKSKGRFESPTGKLGGVPFSGFSSAFSKEQSKVRLNLGSSKAAEAPIAVEVSLPEAHASIVLKPTALEKLAAPFGVALPVEGVTLSGEANLEFEKQDLAAPVTGKLELTLAGYIPPHPVELSGFVFGDKTLFETDLRVNELRDKIDLKNSVVTAGAFKLKGGGLVQRFEDYLDVNLDLKGQLACSALAEAALESRLGRTLGKMASKVARQTVDGSVAVIVNIKADTRALDQARVLRTIGVGCGLKPFKDIDVGAWLDQLPEMPELGPSTLKPPDTKDRGAGRLPSLPSSLPSLPSSLPPLPSALPALPRGWRKPEPPDARSGQRENSDTQRAQPREEPSP